MAWFTHAVEALARGEQATIRPRGNSMRPKVQSGARVVLKPADRYDVTAGDVVLCKVKGRVYLHLAKACRGDGSVLIGNNRGGTNGWTNTIYGIAIEIDNTVAD